MQEEIKFPGEIDQEKAVRAVKEAAKLKLNKGVFTERMLNVQELPYRNLCARSEIPLPDDWLLVFGIDWVHEPMPLVTHRVAFTDAIPPKAVVVVDRSKVLAGIDLQDGAGKMFIFDKTIV